METIAKQSFRGLTDLQSINLKDNRLTTLPSGVLNNIGKSTSLQYLDLSSNSISTIADDAFVAVSSLTFLIFENNKYQNAMYIFPKWLNVLGNLKYLVFGSATNGFGIFVTIGSSVPHLSLQVLDIKTIRKVTFKTKLCPTFPNVNYVVISDTYIHSFPYSMAIHNCLLLKSLDLSGSISNIDLTHLNISIPSLEDLTLARNELTSIEQVLFIKAPNLKSLNLTDNKIQFIDNELAMHSNALLISL